MIVMEVHSVRATLINPQRVILLREKTGQRYLSIWTGASEADAITAKLHGAEDRQPLTHDLLNSLIEVLGGRVESVVIHELKEDIFYARINLAVDGNLVAVDSQVSDALALAVRAGCPILVEESVLDQAGVSLSPGSKKPVLSLSVYSKFLESLKLDDLGQRQS